MFRRFKINETRDKKTWPKPIQRLRQVDFELYFDINPGNIEGWYTVPRQSNALQAIELGNTVIDYGPNIMDGQINLKHGIILQDFLDGFSVLAYGRADTQWQLWNHRGDRYTGVPTGDWRWKFGATLTDPAYTTEATRFDTPQTRCVYEWSGSKLCRVTSRNGSVYFYDGSTESFIGVGLNPSLAYSQDGRGMIAYENGNQLYVTQQAAAGGAFAPPLMILRNDGDYAEGNLYDPAASYNWPWLLNVGGRMWLFYIKTKSGDSVVQYRLEKQSWLTEHEIPTLAGKKDSVRALYLKDNATYRDRIVITWINWDNQTPDPTSTLIPNVYLIYSTPPAEFYGVQPVPNNPLRAAQGNYIPANDTFSAPLDDLAFELDRRS